MFQAAFWGSVAGSALLLGASVGLFFHVSRRMAAYIMAFGTGVLIGAATFELLIEATKKGGILSSSFGFLIGALLFVGLELFIAKKGGTNRKQSKKNPVGHSGLAIFVGTMMDAIPESVIIGVSLLETDQVSWVIIIAIFISNFPEGLSSSIGLKEDGYSTLKIYIMWGVAMILSAISAVVGYSIVGGLSDIYVAFIGAFAAGGIYAMVASTMLPEAFEDSGPIVGFVSAVGLLTACMLAYIQ
ncbi:ZIP family metal transporter [Bacillus sp. HMF5848]|uniref:ZIP family metal transporter n=1 Tax=Bacillus sp. HMF5848 TaxID=2495421 RepID=UPI000F76F6B7|nr:ZIP family metal transporter [Bacillus sp. HMF5848]RSK26694.1 ZIP family metal transporter [Bacillus sp. HMF5848]